MVDFEHYSYILKMATGLISIVNPIGAIPTFITLIGGRNPTPADIKAAALRSTLACVVTLLLTSVAGDILLQFFGITLSSFRIGGGILVLLIAISMLHARPTSLKANPSETQEALAKEDFTIVPMGIPILSGPGAISTVILNIRQSSSPMDRIVLIAVILLIGFIVYTCLRMAIPIRNRIGQTGVNIATRLMGLILAAMAIEFITSGLGEIFPGLKAPGITSLPH